MALPLGIDFEKEVCNMANTKAKRGERTAGSGAQMSERVPNGGGSMKAKEKPSVLSYLRGMACLCSCHWSFSAFLRYRNGYCYG